MTREQKFEIGYQVITWDLGVGLEHAFPVLSRLGFKWFEALFGDSLGNDFARRYLTLGHVGPPQVVTDIDMLQRLALFSKAQSEFGLRISSFYCDAEWINPRIWTYERDRMQAIAHLLKGFGCNYFVCGGGPPPANGRLHTDEENKAFARALEEVATFNRVLGLQTVYHPHLDCFIETREQLDQFMGEVDTDLVGLCLDPAHFQANGDDPVDIARTYIDSITYLHYKDIKGDLASLQGKERYDAFCELGQGHIDLVGITEVLLQNDFDGLAIIELDYSNTPDESCERNMEYVTKELGLTLTLN